MADPLHDGDPARVGPYRLHARLGGGGMGQVFLGRSPGGHTVAVKVVRPELADDADFRRRFTTEVKAARRVGGLYTAQVLDADPDGNPPWLATAYIPGPTLHRAVAEHGPLPAESVAMLGAGLAEGLAAVHAAGLVHRDLKPANVLLASDGPRLIDFGIARALDSTTYTRTSTVLGTAAFMSPEQARAQQVGPASDVFSLGCVLAFAATGRSPFGGGSVHSVLFRVVHEDPDLFGLPEPLTALIATCLAKAAHARPGPDEVLTALDVSTPSARAREGGQWLPEALTEIIIRRTATTLAETKRGPIEDPAGAQAVHPPRRSTADGGQPRQGSLMIGNLSSTRLEALVGGSVLGTIAPRYSSTFPLAAGEYAVQVRAEGRTSAVRRIGLRADTTSRMAFDVPRRSESAPDLVQQVTFTGRRGWAGVVNGVVVALGGASVIPTVVLTYLEAVGYGVESFTSPPALLCFAFGLSLGPLGWVLTRRAVLTLDGWGAIFPDKARKRNMVSWGDIEQVSVVGDGPGADIVLWPGGGGLALPGRPVLGGVAVCRAKDVGVGASRDLRRLRTALLWFAGRAYVEQTARP